MSPPRQPAMSCYPVVVQTGADGWRVGQRKLPVWGDGREGGGETWVSSQVCRTCLPRLGEPLPFYELHQEKHCPQITWTLMKVFVQCRYLDPGRGVVSLLQPMSSLEIGPRSPEVGIPYTAVL